MCCFASGSWWPRHLTFYAIEVYNYWGTTGTSYTESFRWRVRRRALHLIIATTGAQLALQLVCLAQGSPCNSRRSRRFTLNLQRIPLNFTDLQWISFEFHLNFIFLSRKQLEAHSHEWGLPHDGVSGQGAHHAHLLLGQRVFMSDVIYFESTS